MRTKNFMIIAILIFVSGSMFAQGPNSKHGNRGNGFMNIPDLTEAQKTKLTEMRTANMKEMLPLRNELKEKQARLNTISTGDNVNMKEVNKTIDEIGILKTTMAKKRAAHRQGVRKILTDDQKVFFDMHAGQKGPHGKNGKGQMNKHCPNK
ncbi:MAG: Spy/CpxP family protein refolding chaperone [Bacteroidales bacterium]|nr:Spy/CpxP family protein refolding chaperone [Bacteroidales bacterium]